MAGNIKEPKIIKIDINRWRQKLGPELLVKIIRMLIGINRIYALWNLMTQTAKTNEEKKKARSARNRFASFVLSNGILHELYRVLGPLAGDMKDRSTLVFEKIKEILKIFDQNPLRSLLTEFRDKIAFHIDEQIIDAGININKDNVVNFIESDSDAHGDTYYQFADFVSIYGFLGFFKDEFPESKNMDFDEFYKGKLEEFMLYTTEVQRSLITRFDELLGAMVSEFQLEAVESD